MRSLSIVFAAGALAACSAGGASLDGGIDAVLTDAALTDGGSNSDAAIGTDGGTSSNLCPALTVPTALPPRVGSPDFMRTETAVPWDHARRCPSRSACGAGEGVKYEVGPGKPFGEPRDVPWLSLQACDQVLISYRSTPYTDIVVIGARGEKDKYIAIRGVPGPGGERPIFDGNNAVMPANTGANQYTDVAGMIMVIKPTNVSNRAYLYKPGYLSISGLEIRNVRAPASVRHLDQSTTGPWPNFSAGIYISPADHIAITDCEFADNSLGLFVNSQDAEASQSRDLLIQANYFHGNGMVNMASMHNAYTEAIGTIYEFNYFGPPVVGTGGDNVKERSAGLVIRYNYFEDGVDLLALRDPQSNADFEALALDAQGARLASQLYVYSNLFWARTANIYGDPPTIVGHGDGIYGDSKMVRDGSLFFYRNRVVSTVDQVQYKMPATSLFDLINTRAPTTVVALNNLFYAKAHTNAGTAAPFGLFTWQGLADWHSNWINLFQSTTESMADGGLAVGTRFDGTGLNGLFASTESPGFLNLDTGMLLSTSSSPFYSLGAPYPQEIVSRDLVPAHEPVATPFAVP